MRVGFTGTQRGINVAQFYQVYQLLAALNLGPKGPITQFRHGDCIGADAEAHNLVRLNFKDVVIVGHPPTNPSKRAFCKVDIEMSSFDYLVRNRMIVNNCDVLVATPGEMTEQLRSGTWSTIRYARKRLLPRSIYVVYPDGEIG